MLKWQKILTSLVILVASIFTINVKALTTNDGNLPDPPEGVEKYVIIKSGSDYLLQTLDDTAYLYMYQNGSTIAYNNITTSVSQYYINGSNEWSIVQSNNSGWDFAPSELVATTVPIWDSSHNNIVIKAGTGFPLPSLLGEATEVVGIIIAFLGTVTTNLLSNTIFQLLIGAIVLILVVGIIKDLVKRFGKKGRAMRASARYWKQPF